MNKRNTFRTGTPLRPEYERSDWSISRQTGRLVPPPLYKRVNRYLFEQVPRLSLLLLALFCAGLLWALSVGEKLLKSRTARTVMHVLFLIGFFITAWVAGWFLWFYLR